MIFWKRTLIILYYVLQLGQGGRGEENFRYKRQNYTFAKYKLTREVVRVKK